MWLYTNSMQITLEYIAGFTDGEGSIGLCGNAPRITWGQNKPEVLKAMREWFQERGIKCCWNRVWPKPPKRPNPIYMLFISRKNLCEKVCRMLLPSLIVKRDDCRKLIAWIEAHPYAYRTEPIDVDAFKALAGDGYTQGAISTKLGYCRAIIARTAKQLGIRFKMGGKSVDGKRLAPMSQAEIRLRRIDKEKSARCQDCRTRIYKPHKRCKSCAQKEKHRRRKELSSRM